MLLQHQPEAIAPTPAKPKKSKKSPATIQTYKNKVLNGLKITQLGEKPTKAATALVKEMWLVVYGEKLDLRYKANWKKMAEANLTELRIKYDRIINPLPTAAEVMVANAAAITERQLKRDPYKHRHLSVVA